MEPVLVGDLIVIDHRFAQDHDQPGSYYTDDKSKPQKCVPLFLSFFKITLSHGVAGDNAAGVGNALRQYGT